MRDFPRTKQVILIVRSRKGVPIHQNGFTRQVPDPDPHHMRFQCLPLVFRLSVYCSTWRRRICFHLKVVPSPLGGY